MIESEDKNTIKVEEAKKEEVTSKAYCCSSKRRKVK